MKLILIRHGETSWNAENKLQSYSDIELNKKGFLQAELTAKELKDINPDLIISSPLIRAKQTAKAINKFHNKDIKIIKRMTERNFGKLEGINYLKLTKKMLDIYENDLYDEYDIEKVEDVKKRIKSFWMDFHIDNFNKTVFIISHSSAIKTLLGIILDKSHKEILEIVNKPNCSITTIDFKEPHVVNKYNIGYDKHL